MTMARGSIISKYVNKVTRKIIEETVAEEYKDSGIDNNPEGLFLSTGANLIGTKIVRQKRPIPTIGSWYRRLCRKAESNTNIEAKYHYPRQRCLRQADSCENIGSPFIYT